MCSGRYILLGEAEWLVEGNPDQIREVATGLASFAEPLSDRLLVLNFGNAVGIFKVPFLGRVEVHSGKWDFDAFDRMLLEITEIAAGLPFTSKMTGALPYERSISGQESLLYHAFVYLRYSVSRGAPFEEQVLPALRVVLNDPHRLFERVRRDRKIFAISKVDARTLQNIVSGRGRLQRVPHLRGSAHLLSSALHGHLPECVDEPDVQVDIDTGENRFVKRVLDDALWIVLRMREVLARRESTTFVRSLSDQCDEIERNLAPIARDPFWRGIGNMIHVPSGSTVLQHRRGYRQIYRHFVKSRLSSRVPLAPATLADLLEMKDVALLYEIWCYFSLVSEVTRLIGKPVRMSRPDSDEMQLSVRQGFKAEWGNGTRLLFNARFARNKPPARLAYSVSLRPDFVIEIGAGRNEGLHLFDAKFRVDAIMRVLEETEASDETEEIQEDEQSRTFKVADLYKMHTYRDAIDRARSVWALYPGDQFAFFSVDGKFIDPGSLPDRLEGVGAVPFHPSSGDNHQIRTVLQRLLAGAV